MELNTRKGKGCKLGVNGFGRIGKLTAWHHVARKYFDELVINIGRKAGRSLEDIAHYAARDSTYGSLQGYLYGHNSKPVIEELDEDQGSMRIDGVKVTFLRSSRNPRDIGWAEHNVKVVVDTTGTFLDPTLPPDHSAGSLRGHLAAGAKKVILSAPFKLKEKGISFPDDVVTTVMGVNTNEYDPRRHKIISNASCTTTCLAHMVKPMLNHFGAKKILTASMVTVHAATGTQAVLDRLSKSGAKDLRKSRSILNNIILTTTGAADALKLVIHEMEEIGFIAESVRIPTSTGSLIVLVLNIQQDLSGEKIRRELLNDIYRQAAQNDPNGYIHYTDSQNVSVDIIGLPRAAAIIEGAETHTRTAQLCIDLDQVPELDADLKAALKGRIFRAPVTQAVIFGWYDNEMGSYVNMLGDRTVSVAEHL